jgi:hypothetical protein
LSKTDHLLLDERLVDKLEETKFKLWIEEEIQIQKDKKISEIYLGFLKGKKNGI